MDNKKRGKRRDIVIIIIIFLFLLFLGAWLQKKIYESPDRPSPSDIIHLRDLYISEEGLFINGTYGIALVAGTKSMDPLMDENTILIVKEIQNVSKIHKGDIISFYGPANQTIVHRVIQEFNGEYLLTKGDNNKISDPFRVYPKDVRYIIIGILY